MTAIKKDEIPGASRQPLLTLRKELCRACTHCIRVCPTEAIRVRRGKAEVLPHRCVQCGECLRVCPWEAWTVQGNSVFGTEGGKDAGWAVLDPAVFGQFGGGVPPGRIMKAFGEIGFSGVKDLAEGTKIYREEVARFLSSEERPVPAISSGCPAVVQLVQVKYPLLLENLVPFAPPYEIAAARLKDSLAGGSAPVLYYIVPCLAKAQAAATPLSSGGGYSGAVPVAGLYSSLKSRLRPGAEKDSGTEPLQSSPAGLEWSFTGGESRALGMDATLAVDGIHHVARVLELAESGLLGDVPFIEAWSCPGGCLGGPLNVQNPYWARFHMLSWTSGRPPARPRTSRPAEAGEGGRYRLARPLQARRGMRLDEDLKAAMEKLRRIDEVVKKFPGVDCGSCGCPTCLALAEDVVQGRASERDCIYALKRMRPNPQQERKGFRNANDESQR